MHQTKEVLLIKYTRCLSGSVRLQNKTGHGLGHIYPTLGAFHELCNATKGGGSEHWCNDLIKNLSKVAILALWKGVNLS